MMRECDTSEQSKTTKRKETKRNEKKKEKIEGKLTER